MKQRELKFRAWDGKEMTTPALEFDDSSKPFTVTDKVLVSGINLRWMQFTGLLDKEGKEIYEKDLIECAPSGIIGVVEWVEELAQFDLKVTMGGEPYSITPYSERNDKGWNLERKKVGNIYETPNLLEP